MFHYTLFVAGTWSYNPSDSTCIGSVVGILLVEIFVCVCSLAAIIAVIWLWIRGRRGDSVTLAAVFEGGTLCSAVRPSEPAEAITRESRHNAM